MLSTTRPRFDVAKSRVLKKTLGKGGSSFERGLSGPKNMTVGCVIFTVPRRKSVSQAVSTDRNSAKTEIVTDMPSVVRTIAVHQRHLVQANSITPCSMSQEYPRTLNSRRQPLLFCVYSVDNLVNLCYIASLWLTSACRSHFQGLLGGGSPSLAPDRKPPSPCLLLCNSNRVSMGN